MRYLFSFLSVFLFGCQSIPEKQNKAISPDMIGIIETPIKIEKPKLEIEQFPSPNFENRKALILVLHHTDDNDDAFTLKHFSKDSSKVSSHYLIGRTGKIYQFVNEEKRAFHAGVSKWGTITDVNSVSIGIELSNNGKTEYTEEQIQSLIELSKDIITRHKIHPKFVLGHLEVAPGRKIDPYINFPWKRLVSEGIAMDCSTPIEDIVLPKRFSWERTLSEIGYGQKPIKNLNSFRIRYLQEDHSHSPTEYEKKYIQCIFNEINKQK